MALNFPDTPTVGQIFPSPPQVGVPQWQWDGNEWVSASAGVSVPTPIVKNYIINGGMQISQEQGTNALTTSGTYPADQFFQAFINATVSTAQNTTVTPNSSHRIRVTVTAAHATVAAGDYLYLATRLEGLRIVDLKLGTATAQQFVLRFGCRGPAGTYCVAFKNATVARSYVATYTIAAGEANTDVVKSVTLIGDTTGTWAIDNTLGMEIEWGLMVGSTFQTTAGSWAAGNFIGTSSQFNLCGTNGNIFDLFDVGLYLGSSAPTFTLPEYIHETLECLRYWRVDNINMDTNYTNTSGQAVQVVVFSPRMRANPAIGTSASSTSNAGSLAVPLASTTAVVVSCPNAAAGRMWWIGTVNSSARL
jgi:hypothetical protein